MEGMWLDTEVVETFKWPLGGAQYVLLQHACLICGRRQHWKDHCPCVGMPTAHAQRVRYQWLYFELGHADALALVYGQKLSDFVISKNLAEGWTRDITSRLAMEDTLPDDITMTVIEKCYEASLICNPTRIMNAHRNQGEE